MDKETGKYEKICCLTKSKKKHFAQMAFTGQTNFVLKLMKERENPFIVLIFVVDLLRECLFYKLLP